MQRQIWHYNYKPLETTNKRWSGVMLGGAVIGGLVGWGTSAATAKKKQNAQTVLGPRDTAEGKLYGQTLEDRMAGRGLVSIPTTGYDQSVLDASTAPYAAAGRYGAARAREASGSALSAAGLGRSSLKGFQAGDITLQSENAIMQRVADLTLANEQEKASERLSNANLTDVQIRDALSKYGNFTGAVTAGENAKYQSAFDTENVNRGIEQTNRENMYGSILSGIGGGAAGAGTGTSSGFLSGLINTGKSSGGSGSSSGMTIDQFIAALTKAQNNRQANLVNMGNTTI